MTPEQLDRLEGLLAKATPGPWVPNYAQPGAYARIETDAHGYFNDGWVVASELLGPDAEHNLALIVEAVDALPPLIASLKAAREDLTAFLKWADRVKTGSAGVDYLNGDDGTGEDGWEDLDTLRDRARQSLLPQENSRG